MKYNHLKINLKNRFTLRSWFCTLSRLVFSERILHAINCLTTAKKTSHYIYKESQVLRTFYQPISVVKMCYIPGISNSINLIFTLESDKIFGVALIIIICDKN